MPFGVICTFQPKKRTTKPKHAGEVHTQCTSVFYYITAPMLGTIDTLNISYDAVSRIVRSYKQNGCLLKEKTRGRKKGEKRTLSVKQEREIQRLIIDKYPDQMKLGFALWTRAAV